MTIGTPIARWLAVLSLFTLAAIVASVASATEQARHPAPPSLRLSPATSPGNPRQHAHCPLWPQRWAG